MAALNGTGAFPLQVLGAEGLTRGGNVFNCLLRNDLQRKKLWDRMRFLLAGHALLR
jgi:hypothetical protein